ncbi:hypothetical protein Emed_001155 [Eimeria media]
MGESATVGSGGGLGGLLARWWRANRKAKMVLLLGPVGPFSVRPEDHLNGAVHATHAMHATQLRSEGCAVQCLFSSWLTKTSKWLKTPRLRYVMLLAVTPDRGCCMQRLRRSSSSSSRSSSSSSDGLSTNDSTNASYEEEPSQQQQPTDKRAAAHLLLVAFKVPLLSRSTQPIKISDLQGLQRAEPSEAFTIDNTHRAVCQQIPHGEGKELVLIIEGLGGRLLVLGEAPPFSSSALSSSPSSAASLSPLEELAKLINDAAPSCAAPKPSRWSGLLSLFSAAAAADGFGPLALLPDSNRRETEWRRGEQHQPDPKRRCSREIQCMQDEAEVYEQLKRKSLVAFFMRCSVAACHAICRPLTLAVRYSSFNDSRASINAAHTRYAQLNQEAEEAACSACNACTASNRRGDDGLGACSPHACSWIVQRKRGLNDSLFAGGSTGTSFEHYTLRQLIDDQQRAVAAYAVRERCRNVALLQQEQQGRTQQASKALMNDHGQLHPQM